MADNFQQLQYNAWESQHLIKHSDLMKKYNDLKQKETLLSEQTGGKVTRRDLLLTQKKNMSITKLGTLELLMIEKDDDIDSTYASNISIIENTLEESKEDALKTYNVALQRIKASYEDALKAADQKFNKAKKYYDEECKKSHNKCKREFDTKKRILEERGENIDAEKAITTRTAAELTIAANKIKILTEIKRSIDVIAMSRSSVPNGKFLYPLPTMPEPLSESAPKPVVERQQSTATAEEILASLGEDPSVAVMRAEAAAEDRRIRREAFEEEMQRNEIMLAHRRQLEREAEERRTEREARERQERQQQPITPPLTQDEEEQEDDWDMSQEEIDAHIAKRKAEMKTPRRENKS